MRSDCFLAGAVVFDRMALRRSASRGFQLDSKGASGRRRALRARARGRGPAPRARRAAGLGAGRRREGLPRGALGRRAPGAAGHAAPHPRLPAAAPARGRHVAPAGRRRLNDVFILKSDSHK